MNGFNPAKDAERYLQRRINIMKNKIGQTLYKKNSNGKIQQWDMYVNGFQYWAEYGQVGGKIQADTPTVCVGKNIGKSNETTPEQQALLEAEAKYTKQIDIKGYVEDLTTVDEFNFSPMLAHTFDKHGDKLPDLIMGSPKLDGVRCYITKDGAFSRNGKRWVATKFIEEEAKKIFDKFPDAIIDGELYTHKLKEDFNKIVSLAKKTKHIEEEDWKEIEEHLEYHVFDIYFPNQSVEFSRRYIILKSLIEDLELAKIIVVRHDYIEKENFLNLYQEYMCEGYEGIMLRNPHGGYECKRSYLLQKYKEFKDEEYKIEDILEGDGNRSGMFGRFRLRTEDGKVFEANSRGNEDYYRELWVNKQNYIGKLVTIRFQNKTPDGIPRFPVAIGIRDYE